jgi:hypothetical protein
MTIVEKIKEIYPELQDSDFRFTIIVQNDSNGEGDYIAKWEHPILARPTNEQLS